MWTIAIVGPGGVGGLLGGVLARAGHHVVYVARPQTAVVLQAEGMTVHSVQFGDFTVPAQAVEHLTTPVDLCIVATKATSLAAALANVVPSGLVLPLLNGVEHMALLRAHFPPDQVVAGAIRVESTRVAPGRIEHTSPFSWIEIGSDTTPREQVEAVAAQLRSAGFHVAVRDSESALLWDKLALLAPLALLTTAAQAPVGTVRTQRRAELESVVTEVATVARANGTHTDPAAVLATIDEIPEGLKSSMLRDAEVGRPLELDAIGGSVVHGGARLGIPTPATAKVVARLRARTR